MRIALIVPVVLLAGCAANKTPEPAPQQRLAKIDATNIADAQSAGYKIVNEKGTRMYCKKNLLTGTRLKYVTTCLTEQQWQESAIAAQDTLKPAPVVRPVRGN